MSNHKDNEIQDSFVQKDIFRELADSEDAVSDIYNFKEEFRVKTIYENFKGLYSFGDKFKFILSFITGSLAAIGFFFLLYIDGFTGFFKYALMILAGLFAASFSFGLEKARYTIVPIVVKSWLRDKKVQKGLAVAALSLQIVSISSTIYGTYQVVNLFYTPTLADVEAVGGEQNALIADYGGKIEAAKADKAKIDIQRDKYHRRTGKPSGWIEHEVYSQLTTDISSYEAQITDLRQQIRDDKQQTKADNKDTEAQHAQSKYLFVWVSSIVSLLCEILLSVVLFFLIKYKFSTLKQLDTIQAPLQTVLQLVENPLTQLKSTLIGGGQLVMNSPSNVPPFAINQGGNIDPISLQNEEPGATAKTGANVEAKNRRIGFQIPPKKSDKKQPQNNDNQLNAQKVGLDELGQIQLKIYHYKKKVTESENRLKTLKQKAAIKRTKAALKNRKNKLRYWEKKKRDFQGKIIA